MSSNQIGRDVSWLAFNKRVLYQSTRHKHVSLIERLKFIGISSSNLDEFLMVRVADARLNNINLYKKLWKDIKTFKVSQEKLYESHIAELNKQGIILSKYKDLSDKNKDMVKDIFKKIYPLIVPMVFTSSMDEFPLINSKEVSMMALLDDDTLGIVPLGNIDRVFRLGDEVTSQVYITVEEIISQFLSTDIFIGHKIKYKTSIRILREAAVTLDSNSNIYIVERMKDVLRQRENSSPICVEISDKSIPNDVLTMIQDMFGVDRSMIYKTDSTLDLRFLIGKPFNISGSYESFDAHLPSNIWHHRGILNSIDKGDVVLHHPFDSFEPVIQFISESADDPDVVGIRQTLYRVSSEDSPIIEALCRASRKGKDVSVLLEIKARFDEEQNISLIDKLKDAGCKVICGLEEYKTHAKFALVVKKISDNNYRCYAHIGTGNYNDKTSSIYTDLSLYTNDRKICTDLITVFNILSGKSNPEGKVEKIKFAPFNIRTSIYRLIDREVKNVKAGGKGFVIIKVNSISDTEMIEKIYDASRKGVVFNIICRGICSIKPINNNIKIRSIVGRFLEHSRVYYFFNNSNQETYISSADLLTRNLDKRVEIMVPVTSKKCRNHIYRILSTYLLDEVNTFTMTKRGLFNVPKDEGYDSHRVFIDEVIKRGKITKKEFKIARTNKK